MGRHLVAPSPVPEWGLWAYGLVGVPEGHPLELRALDVAAGEVLGEEDLVLLEMGGGTAEAGLSEMDYLRAIHEGLKAFFASFAGGG